MKTVINYILTVLLTLISFYTYHSFLVYIAVFHILGKLTLNLPLVLKWNGILSPIIAIVLALLTGTVYNLLRIKGYKKSRIVFILIQLVCFAYSVIKVLEIYRQI